MGHKLKKCPCCGQEVSDFLWVDRELVRLGAMQQRLVNILKAAPEGLTVYDVVDRLYSSSASGGPSGNNIIAVMAAHINKKLKPLGISIRGTGGPGSVYRLVETKEVARCDS